MGHGNPIAYVLGSGNYGFGMLTLSLDWNYIAGVMSPMYTPLWANAHQYVEHTCQSRKRAKLIKVCF